MTREIDKSDWGDGPWQSEDDEYDFNFGDVQCRIVRAPRDGHLNGYVRIPPSHPWFGKSWTDLQMPLDGVGYGEVSFSGRFNEGTFASVTDDGWWVGFHCGGTWDFCPGPGGHYIGLDMEPTAADYRDVAYVRARVEVLARSAIAALSALVSAGGPKSKAAE